MVEENFISSMVLQDDFISETQAESGGRCVQGFTVHGMRCFAAKSPSDIFLLVW